MQRINNNIVTSEYLKSDERISKVSKTIRLCYQQLMAGLLVLFKQQKPCLSNSITTSGKLIITQKE